MSNPSLGQVHASLRLVSRTTPGATAWRHMSSKPQPLAQCRHDRHPALISRPGGGSTERGPRRRERRTRAGDAVPRLPRLAGGVWPLRWSSSAACAQAGVVSVLTPAEVLVAARRLAGARPHLAAVAGIVAPEDLWQLCRDELTGVDLRAGGWDIRGRWFGVVVGATPRLGELRRGETIWRVIAARIAPPERPALR
jgi:hypothetical protein